jgi:hypothetical protein
MTTGAICDGCEFGASRYRTLIECCRQRRRRRRYRLCNRQRDDSGLESGDQQQ